MKRSYDLVPFIASLHSLLRSMHMWSLTKERILNVRQQTLRMAMTGIFTTCPLNSSLLFNEGVGHDWLHTFIMIGWTTSLSHKIQLYFTEVELERGKRRS